MVGILHSHGGNPTFPWWEYYVPNVGITFPITYFICVSVQFTPKSLEVSEKNIIFAP